MVSVLSSFLSCFKQTLDGGTLKVIELSEMLSLLLLHFFVFVSVDEKDI